MTPTLKLLAKHLITSLGLTNNQVYILGQNIDPIKDTGLHICLSLISEKVQANNNKTFVGDDGKMYEEVMVNHNQFVQITVLSRDMSAIERLYEVEAALNNYKIRELAFTEQFKISFINSAQSLTTVEGGSILNMYAIRLTILRVNSVISEIPYYDEFDHTITTDGV